MYVMRDLVKLCIFYYYFDVKIVITAKSEMSIECMYLFLAPKRQLHSLSKSREVKIELALINFLRIVNVLATAKTIQNAAFATKYLCKYLTMYTWKSYCCRQIIFLFLKNNSFEV